MDSYQGLFYLVAGFFTFFIFFVFFREWGWRIKWKEKNFSLNQNQNQNQKAELSLDSLSTVDLVDDDKRCAPWLGLEELRVVDIHHETHDIKSFRLERVNGQLFPTFREGQFLTFQIGPQENKLFRSYSISTSIVNRRVLAVAVKKLPEGKGSGWFHSLVRGDRLWAYTPSGLFSPSPLRESHQGLIFVAGGIGITPFMSMIQTFIDLGLNTSPIYLFYGMRSEKDLAFHDELTLLSKRYKFFYYFPILSHAESDWPGDRGFISYDYLQTQISKSSATAKDLKIMNYFFCGPPVMTDSLMESLKAHGVSDSQMHFEKFASPANETESSTPIRKAQVQFNGQVYSYESSETLLEFLESCGESPNYACRVGVCGACKCRMISGEVEQESESGLTTEEIEQGFILTCVAKPLTNVTLVAND